MTFGEAPMPMESGHPQWRQTATAFPALLAAVAAELVMGSESVTPYQRSAQAPMAD